MIDSWIDLMVDALKKMECESGALTVPNILRDNKFPESISTVPTALIYAGPVSVKYPQGGPNYDVWQGEVHFHLTKSTKKSEYPMIYRYYKRIRDVFEANVQLSEHVVLKLRAENGSSISEPSVLQYGSEAPHFGLVAYWTASERYS